MSYLFTPLSIRQVRLRNRIVCSPMCQYSSVDGFANDWHMVNLGSRAVGGAGLVFTEACAISPEGRITPKDLGIWKNDHLDNLKKICDFIHQQDATPGIQLAHAGRKASHNAPWEGGRALQPDEGAWQPLAPVPIPFKQEDPAPKAMDKDEIIKMISDFEEATVRAKTAGFRVVEIHAAHGYLLHEFLSPLCNQRTDEYGGSFENRIRLLLEIVEAVRRAWPEEFPLFVRISATDWATGGWTIEATVALVKILLRRGVDVIDCSSGGILPAVKIPVGPLYQVPFAARIKKESGIMTGAVGMITKAAEAEQILANGEADLIFIARQFLRDPYFGLHAAKELGDDIPWPVQYERAKHY